MIPRLKQWLSGGPSASASADASVRLRVLMVCTGNICRSPTAEAVLRAKLQQAGLQDVVRVDSAGTQGYNGNVPPDARAVKAAARRGYDLSGLRARPLRADDYTRFDWVLAMDQSHMDWMRKRAPAEASDRLSLLMPFARRHPGITEVPDPYYGGPAGFEHVLDLVEDACDGVAERLRAGQPLVGL